MTAVVVAAMVLRILLMPSSAGPLASACPAALATRRSILLVHLVATTIAFEFDYNSRAAERRDRARF